MKTVLVAALLGICVPLSMTRLLTPCIQVLIPPEGQKRPGSTHWGGGETDSLQGHIVQFVYVFRDIRTVLGNQNYMTDAAAKCLFWVRCNFWIISMSGIILLNLSILYWQRGNVAPYANFQPDSPWAVAQYSWLLFIVRSMEQDWWCWMSPENGNVSICASSHPDSAAGCCL